MTSSQKCLLPPGGRAIVLSIKPKYAELILAGTKTVELRRMWAAEQVGIIVLYASSPVQRIVGTVKVQDVVQAAPSTIWKHSTQRGGGLTKRELLDYFSGKKSGYAVLLEDAVRFDKMIDPQSVIENFVPPQSFRYMSAVEMRKLEQKLRTRRGKS
jgi:predicted transcriptional regulator